MAGPKPLHRNPWAWIPTLYFAQGLPNVLTVAVSIVVYKNLGLSNTDAAFYTSWFYLPWVLKPLWSPLVDIGRTRRWWIWMTQFVTAAGFAAIALTIPTAHYLQLTIAGFWLLAFNSATHDIAADGFYILAATEREQAFFSGIRNAAFNLAKITAQGLLVALAGIIAQRAGSFPFGWSVTFGLAAGIFLALALYHWLILPKPSTDLPGHSVSGTDFLVKFFTTFGIFFKKPRIATLLCFLLLYRFGEAQLMKIAQPFLLDPRAEGGLGLSNSELSLVYGTVGVIALICGGLLGGFFISRHGLKRWLWPMLFAIHLPDAVFIYLAHAQPTTMKIIGVCVAVEQFGYGFGFSAFMLYMIYIARGEHATAHYAICTGFMALGMMAPGMWSGWLQEHIGYPHFFEWVLLATIPSFLVTWFIPLDPEFGRKNEPATS